MGSSSPQAKLTLDSGRLQRQETRKPDKNGLSFFARERSHFDVRLEHVHLDELLCERVTRALQDAESDPEATTTTRTRVSSRRLKPLTIQEAAVATNKCIMCK